ncbi:MAG TPA: hypothetical protein VKT70_12820 [Stellaceae bacterium]|nr:hypothetical protein [Stellaceae bacterium]
MRKILLSLLALFVLPLSGALAQNCPPNPNNLTNGTPADATQVMANFNNLLNCINALGTGVGRNRLVNGAMVIDQRNEGAVVSIATGQEMFVTDQWQVDFVGAATNITAQRVVPGPALAGFNNALKVTVGTGSATVGANDFLTIRQNIEGVSIADLQWGTANAATVSLSEWVNSSVSGTITLALINGTGTRSYVNTCGVTANVWVRCMIPNIAGDTAGTWSADNGVGVEVRTTLTAGSAFQTSPGSFLAGFFIGTPGQTQLTTTTGATLQVTGAQFQAGPAVTVFDTRPFATELALCQRYYEKSYDPGTPVGTSTQANASFFFVTFPSAFAGAGGTSAPFKATKRASPRIVLFSPFSGVAGKVFDKTNGADVVGSVFLNSTNGFSWFATAAAAAAQTEFHVQWTADAGL